MPVSLFSGVIIRAALEELLPIFELDTGISVDARYDLNPIVKKRIDAGEAFDVVITNPYLIDELVSAGKVDSASYLDIGGVGMGLAVHEDAVQPTFNSVDEFKEFLLSAPTIAYAAEGTSGKVFKVALKNLGILDQITNRLVPMPGGQSAKEIRSGAIAVAALPKSVILAAQGTKLAGMFPDDLQTCIDLGVAISTGGRNNLDSKRLADYLAGSGADDIFAKYGVDRGS